MKKNKSMCLASDALLASLYLTHSRIQLLQRPSPQRQQLTTNPEDNVPAQTFLIPELILGAHSKELAGIPYKSACRGLSGPLLA